MLVKNRYPGISVVLFKNVGRQKLSGSGANALAVSTRFSGQDSVLDVTQYLGERGSVRVNKSVREPAGTFTIEFTDQLVPSADDSLYGLFEPMDIVEIRMAANAFEYPGATPSVLPSSVSALSPIPSPTTSLPIMMRGFVSHVSRSQVMGSDGKPTRKVTISGKDYGKIWEIYHIYYNPYMPDLQNYITKFKLYTRFGIAFKAELAGTLVADIFDKILNPFINTMKAKGSSPASFGSSPLLTITPDVQLTGGTVAPFGVSNWQGGSIYELLRTFTDSGIWNELFIEDREKGPYVVYRPNPFIAAGGDPRNSASYIQKNTTLPAVTDIDASHVISLEVSRSDADVANYFWVESAYYDASFGFVGKAMAATGGPANTFIITNYGNVDPSLYGFKRMSESTSQDSPSNTSGGNGTPNAQNKQGAVSGVDWINLKRQQLVQQNLDNIVFESGYLQLIGNEKVKAGTYVMLQHGNMKSPYYVVSVTHTFQPFGSYSTTAVLERGGGFIDRAQRGGASDSPYYAELADSQT